MSMNDIKLAIARGQALADPVGKTQNDPCAKRAAVGLRYTKPSTVQLYIVKAVT